MLSRTGVGAAVVMISLWPCVLTPRLRYSRSCKLPVGGRLEAVKASDGHQTSHHFRAPFSEEVARQCAKPALSPPMRAFFDAGQCLMQI